MSFTLRRLRHNSPAAPSFVPVAKHSSCTTLDAPQNVSAHSNVIAEDYGIHAGTAEVAEHKVVAKMSSLYLSISTISNPEHHHSCFFTLTGNPSLGFAEK